MPSYTVYIYTPDMFVQGLPAENTSGNMAHPVPITLTLKSDAYPHVITIEDNDSTSVNVSGQNWVTHNNRFNEVSRNQFITDAPDALAGWEGKLINAAYNLSGGAVDAQGKPLGFTTFRVGGSNFGQDTGPVQGVMTLGPIVPGQSYTFTSTGTTQPAPPLYPDFYDPTDPYPPPCFTTGTLIETATGPRAVEDLRPGDLVVTRDNGLQPIRWIGGRHIGAGRLDRDAHLRPIRIAARALGDGLPAQDLVVSPQHRMLVRSRIASRMFGSGEVLVAAKKLVGMPGITVETECAAVTYFHILFDRHEVVIANGAETESLYVGPQALLSVGAAARAEILTLFPELAESAVAPRPARLFAGGRRIHRFLERHLQAGQPLCAGI